MPSPSHPLPHDELLIMAMDGPALTQRAFDLGLAPLETEYVAKGHGLSEDYTFQEKTPMPWHYWHPHRHWLQAVMVFSRLPSHQWLTAIFTSQHGTGRCITRKVRQGYDEGYQRYWNVAQDKRAAWQTTMPCTAPESPCNDEDSQAMALLRCAVLSRMQDALVVAHGECILDRLPSAWSYRPRELGPIQSVL